MSANEILEVETDRTIDRLVIEKINDVAVGQIEVANNVALSVNTQSLNKIRDDMLDIVKLIGGN